ncbi:MAG: methyltransferase domain-containing protein [Pseudorhodoplanes sp.]|nr:methyltransferase domain-containing protein [Pseudorhodoplanes sp.]
MLDKLLDWRDAWIENPDFQRFSARFPLTRPIARRQASALFDLCAGFVYSQVLFACVQLGLFDCLRGGPKSIDDIAGALGLPAPAAERLLRAAASLKLVAPRRGHRFGLGMLGAALNGNPGVAAMIAHHATLYRDLQDPIALLRGESGKTGLKRYWPYADNPHAAVSENVADYSALMSASQPLVADDILGSYPFGRHRCLLDVGGGEGAFVAAAAARWPKLQLMLFDLPAVAARARKKLAERGLSRVGIFEGSFLSDPLPRGADVISLVRIVHDHDDSSVLALLRAVRAALPPGGVVVIAEPMSGVRGAERAADAYFGFYLLAMGSGRARRPDELCRLLKAAGFRTARRIRTPRPIVTGQIVGHV